MPAREVLIADDGNRASGPATVAAVSATGDVVRPGALFAERAAIRAEPVRVVIDAIGVSAAVAAVGLEPDGTLSPPRDPSMVGWHSGSRIPGDRGPAVMVGHVDSADGPAVFTNLDDLEVGDVIDVENGDGGIVSFAVSSVTRHPKHAFPTDAVYGPTPDSELHLITCGGSFDRETGYADNVVVTATAVG
ncbi:MAG: class F sortase [Jiangellaceae bacterium]